MYLDAYFASVEVVFAHVRNTQREAIMQAAGAVCASLSNKGAWLVMDTGHMLRYEAFLRAGGLAALRAFSYSIAVEGAVHRGAAGTPEQKARHEARLVSLALDQSGLVKGDVVLINSNSGRTPNVIETALQCRDRGIVTIGLASRAQLERCEAVHVSGKKLFDVVDIAIDNGAPYGDAAVETRDNEKMCPMSGLSATFVLWAIQAEAVERLQALGVQPTIYRSVHLGGETFLERQQKQYMENGI